MRSSPRLGYALPAAAFALTLLVRLIFLYQWAGTPYGPHPLLDAGAYHTWAQAIASGELIRFQAFYQSPLYPYLLGLFYAVFGAKLYLAGLIGALLDAGTAAILTFFTARHFGRAAAVLTLLLVAFDRAMIFYAAPPMKEPLALFLLAALLPFAYRAWQEGRARDYALSGLLIGLGAMARGNFLIFAPALALLALWEREGKTAKNILILCAATLIALAPAALHNALASHDFVPLNYADGFNLYIGHSPVANGTNAYPPEVSTDPLREETATAYVASRAAGRTLKPSEVSAYWRGRALNEIFRHPARELWLLKNKIEAFFNGADKYDNYDSTFIAEHFGTILAAPLVGFTLLSTLAAFAVLPALRRRNKAAIFLLFMLGVFFASVMLFYVTDRYRLPAVIFLFPLAGAALPYGLELAREKKARRATAPLLLAAFFAFLGLRPDPTYTDLTAFHWGTLAAVYAGEGRDAEALDALKQGLKANETEVGPQAYLEGAEAATRLGDAAQAGHLMDEALRLFPLNANVRYAIGRNLAARGRLNEAKEFFEKALEIDPSHALSYYALALIAQRDGDAARAASLAHQGLMIDPGNEWLARLANEKGAQP